MNPEFLDVDDVLEIHSQQLDEHGGSDGIRDTGLLESAVTQPMASFGGQFLNDDLFVMAAALLVSLVKNHPFVDGNKRTALLAALTFLDLNGHPIESPSQDLEMMTLDVAEGRLDKHRVANLLRVLARDP